MAKFKIYTQSETVNVEADDWSQEGDWIVFEKRFGGGKSPDDHRDVKVFAMKSVSITRIEGEDTETP